MFRSRGVVRVFVALLTLQITTAAPYYYPEDSLDSSGWGSGEDYSGLSDITGLDDDINFSEVLDKSRERGTEYSRDHISCGRSRCDVNYQYCDGLLTELPQCLLCSDICHPDRVGTNQQYVDRCLQKCQVYWLEVSKKTIQSSPMALHDSPRVSEVEPVDPNGGISVLWGTIVAALVVFTVVSVVAIVVLVVFIRRRRRRNDDRLAKKRIITPHKNKSNNNSNSIRSVTTPLLTNPLSGPKKTAHRSPVTKHTLRVNLTDQNMSTTELTEFPSTKINQVTDDRRQNFYQTAFLGGDGDVKTDTPGCAQEFFKRKLQAAANQGNAPVNITTWPKMNSSHAVKYSSGLNPFETKPQTGTENQEADHKRKADLPRVGGAPNGSTTEGGEPRQMSLPGMEEPDAQKPTASSSQLDGNASATDGVESAPAGVEFQPDPKNDTVATSQLGQIGDSMNADTHSSMATSVNV